MINKLLVAFLNRNKRLIIPTIGAFVKREVEGVGTVLVFVPFLNKDDGVLCSIIKTWSGVDDDNEANEILQQYIAAIHESLNRGQYVIEGIGALKYDSNHIIYLEKEGANTQTQPQVQPQTQSQDTESETSYSEQANNHSSSENSAIDENREVHNSEITEESSNDGDVANGVLAASAINPIGSAIEDIQSGIASTTPQESKPESDPEKSTTNSETTNHTERIGTNIEEAIEAGNENFSNSIAGNLGDKVEQEDNATSPVNPLISSSETTISSAAKEDSMQPESQVAPKVQESTPSRKNYRSLYEDGVQDSGVRYFSPKNSDSDSSSSYQTSNNETNDSSNSYNGGYNNNSYNGAYNAGAIGNESKDIQNIYGRYNGREAQRNAEQLTQQQEEKPQEAKPQGIIIEPVAQSQQPATQSSATQPAQIEKVSEQQRFKELTSQQPAPNRGNVSSGGSRGSSNSSGGSRNGKHPNRRKKVAPKRRKSSDKKGSDLIIWIAVIAVLLTIGVLVYGFNYNSEPTLDDFDMGSDIDMVDISGN
ncbi:MAG: hypothetical protein R3Y50_08495 [Rikenellaceae bacterium]